ncbi:hypothetical protein BY996DRAFT_6420540 [Phakopsora pachyrhizi]|nr:hypothetical protein BY996DRAFT_6420540 [Phakopsora pachyrhizi]
MRYFCSLQAFKLMLGLVGIIKAGIPSAKQIITFGSDSDPKVFYDGFPTTSVRGIPISFSEAGSSDRPETDSRLGGIYNLKGSTDIRNSVAIESNSQPKRKESPLDLSPESKRQQLRITASIFDTWLENPSESGFLESLCANFWDEGLPSINKNNPFATSSSGYFDNVSDGAMFAPSVGTENVEFDHGSAFEKSFPNPDPTSLDKDLVDGKSYFENAFVDNIFNEFLNQLDYPKNSEQSLKAVAPTEDITSSGKTLLNPVVSLEEIDERNSALVLKELFLKESNLIGTTDFKLFLNRISDKIHTRAFNIDTNSLETALSRPAKSYESISAELPKCYSLDQEKYSPSNVIKPKKIPIQSNRNMRITSSPIIAHFNDPDIQINLRTLKSYIYNLHFPHRILSDLSVDNHISMILQEARKEDGVRTDIFLKSLKDFNTAFRTSSVKISDYIKVAVWLFKHRIWPVNPSAQEGESKLFSMVIQEISFQMGLQRSKALEIDGKLNQLQKALQESLSLEPENPTTITLTHLAYKASLIALNQIVLLHRVFTPFDSNVIEKLKGILIIFLKDLYAVWKPILLKKPLDGVWDSIGTDYRYINQFYSEKFYNKVLQIVLVDDITGFIIDAPQAIMEIWLIHFNIDRFGFLATRTGHVIKNGFFSFLKDCTISDFIESYP